VSGLIHRIAHASPAEVAVAVAATLASIAFTLGAGAFVAVRLPADYFVVVERPLPLAGRSLALRVAARVAMNLAGLILVAAGIVLSMPGVPGQGVLTILLGIMLLDFPGKRRVEAALVRRPMVHKGINALRARWKKPPIDVPE
jgi:hypothetical protein